MILQGNTVHGYAQAIVTDVENVGPDGWRHAVIKGLSVASERECETMCTELLKRFIPEGAETHWRVPMEYSESASGDWHAFGRVSFRATA